MRREQEEGRRGDRLKETGGEMGERDWVGERMLQIADIQQAERDHGRVRVPHDTAEGCNFRSLATSTTNT